MRSEECELEAGHLNITGVEGHQGELLLHDDVTVGVGCALQIASFQYVNLR